MKWFKHDCDSIFDDKIQNLITEKGLKGYGFYFAILSLIGMNVKPNNNDFELHHKCSSIARILHIDDNEAKELLETCLSLNLLEETSKKLINGDQVPVITCKKMKLRVDDTYRNYYSQKKKEKSTKNKGNLEETSNKLRSNLEATSNVNKDIDKDKDKDIKTLRGTTTPSEFAIFSNEIVQKWNVFCQKFPVLSQVKELSEKRRSKLKLRFVKESFRNFDEVLNCISQQPFLLGKKEGEWKISFDWLIDNDTNYLKVIEKRYEDKRQESY